MDNILDKDHPSFGTKNAAFLFAIGTRFLTVEAKNPYAVAALERLLMNNNQSVSDTCRVICVFRDYHNVGVRDDLVEEVSYVDFMTDIVNPSWLLTDTVTVTCFSKSISPEDRKHAMERAHAFKEASEGHSPREATKSGPAGSETRVQLVSALVGMGFKKNAVEKFARGLGDRVNKEPLTDLIREGLRSVA